MFENGVPGILRDRGGAFDGDFVADKVGVACVVGCAVGVVWSVGVACGVGGRDGSTVGGVAGVFGGREEVGVGSALADGATDGPLGLGDGGAAEQPMTATNDMPAISVRIKDL